MQDIFISYSTKNYDDACIIKRVLTKNGFSVFMAPDSIPAGSNYTKEIPRAIQACKVFLLLFSSQAQASIWVPAEVETAFKNQKLIVPFILENCPVTEDFDFLLSRSQRIEAYEKKTEALENMIATLNQVLGNEKTTQPQVTKEGEKSAVAEVKETTPVVQKIADVNVTHTDGMEFLGGVYIGELKNGKPHGFGKHETNDYIYEGEYVDGKRCGKGRYSSKKDDYVYEGEYLDNYSHGRGLITNNNGCKTEAEFVKGKMHGVYKCVMTNGYVFTGQYVGGKKDGRWTFIRPDGSSYERIYENGVEKTE